MLTPSAIPTDVDAEDSFAELDVKEQDPRCGAVTTSLNHASVDGIPRCGASAACVSGIGAPVLALDGTAQGTILQRVHCGRAAPPSAPKRGPSADPFRAIPDFELPPAVEMDGDREEVEILVFEIVCSDGIDRPDEDFEYAKRWSRGSHHALGGRSRSNTLAPAGTEAYPGKLFSSAGPRSAKLTQMRQPISPCSSDTSTSAGTDAFAFSLMRDHAPRDSYDWLFCGG